MLDPATVLDRARSGAAPEDWQVFAAARRLFYLDLAMGLFGTAVAVGMAVWAGGPGESGAVAGWFAFCALLCALATLGTSIGLKHVDQFFLVLTPEGMVERHVWLSSGAATRVIAFAEVQAMQLTRKQKPQLIVHWRDGRTEWIGLLTLRKFGPPVTIGERIAEAFARHTASLGERTR